MGISIIENNAIFHMIYININEGLSDKDCIKTNSGNVTKDTCIVSDKNCYRIKNFSKNNTLECFEVVSKDKSEVSLTFNGLSLKNTSNLKRLKLKGLDENAVYINTETNEVFSGGALMHYGINIKKLFGDYSGNIINLKII